MTFALAALETGAQPLPHLAEFVTAADAKSRRLEPIAKHDFAKHIVSPLERRGWLFGLDMADAARSAENALRKYPHDIAALNTLSVECERIANTVYRLFMYAHANAQEMARTGGRAGRVEYAAPFMAMEFARERLGPLLDWTIKLREELEGAGRVPPKSVLEQFSIQDLREMLTDDGLREYRHKSIISAADLESALAMPRTAYKKDRPGRSTDITRECARDCGKSRWNDCATCTRLLLERGEASYKYFAAEWNASTRWYHFWRRVELADNLVGMLGAGYRPLR